VRFWGVQASYAFIEQPQTNGVAERFFRTLKEQIVYGRIYRTVAELREAVETFVDLYNEQWLLEKNGFMSPSATRAAWYGSAWHGGRRVRQLRVQRSASGTSSAALERGTPRERGDSLPVGSSLP